MLKTYKVKKIGKRTRKTEVSLTENVAMKLVNRGGSGDLKKKVQPEGKKKRGKKGNRTSRSWGVKK